MRIDQFITQGIDELIFSDGQAMTLADGRTVAVFSPPSATVSLDMVEAGFEPDIDRTVLAVVGSQWEMPVVTIDETPVDATLQGNIPSDETLVTFGGVQMRIMSHKDQRTFVEFALKQVR